MSEHESEYQNIKTYLDLITKLPFNLWTED